MTSIIRILFAGVMLISLISFTPTVSANLLPDLDASAGGATTFLSIPAAAFLPSGSNTTSPPNYENHGRYVKYFGPNFEGQFKAQVQLPQGAQIISVKACFYDDSASLSAKLNFVSATNYGLTYITQIESTGASGYQEIVELDYPETIDYGGHVYYRLDLKLPKSTGAGSNVWGCGATIEYLPPEIDSSILALGSAAFNPFENGYTYDDWFALRLFYLQNNAAGTGKFMAPVNLPDGASVNKLSMRIFDEGTGYTVNAKIQRADHNGNYSTLGDLNCQGIEDKICSLVIPAFTIDNSQYTYWVHVLLPTSLISNYIYLSGVNLEYHVVPDQHENVIGISNTAFTPFFDSQEYENHARWLIHKHGEGGSNSRGVYVASVNLPDKVTIDGFEACFYDGSTTLAGNAFLIRTRLGVNNTMASASSMGSSGYSGVPDYTVNWNVVDNNQYAYFVYWDLPIATTPVDGGDVVGCGMAVHYHYPVYLPMIVNQ
ncbi:MAG: hypothetical protein CVU39_15865 [Chloroflexi bacterium HGW-Chloroflexi-10]|nr:MAG: hypothetical protein CVU39_15865 [Chloroflexi bacterium HGW-Chloroflexi-10]